MHLIKWFNEINIDDINLVGGKNASLGELTQHLKSMDIKVPFGYAITSDAYMYYIKHNNLSGVISTCLQNLDVDNNIELSRTGLKIRSAVQNGHFPDDLKNEILDAYSKLSNMYTDTEGSLQESTDVAVRSSGTAEDLPDASFAGQQETYLNVRGNSQLLESVKNCFASLYTDRAISYRHRMGYNDIQISVGVQKMVRSDLGSAGVVFTIDTESLFEDIIIINSSWGLGEMVVRGSIKPDEVLVFKKTLGNYMPIVDKRLGDKTHKMIYGTNPAEKTRIVRVDDNHKHSFSINTVQILQLSRWALEIEKHYSKKHDRFCPMDIEWGIDGLDGELYILQARPETTYYKKDKMKLVQYNIQDNQDNAVLTTGVAVGDRINSGRVKIMYSLDGRDGSIGSEKFEKGDILVTDMTDPDWEPIMKIASAIITNKGGRTCHSAIIARELGVPAIVGTTNITKILKNDQYVTVSCCEGDVGKVYDGKVNYNIENIDIDKLPKVNTKIMLNIASPDNAFKFSKLPNSGIGLAREEFIITNFIKVHPNALLQRHVIDDENILKEIDIITRGYTNGTEFFIKKLAYGMARLACAYYPNDVIIRFSDFKSNEYANLLGGKYFEPKEENPMIGWRGASRYYDKRFIDAFKLECLAIKRVRERMGLKNVVVMIPFCRTPEECVKVLSVMKDCGLERGIDGLRVYLMCEVPSNVILAKEFSQHIDGYSIGTNDLTQLTLGLDRDSELVSHIYDERNEAVKIMIRTAIRVSKENGIKIGVCGQAPSDYPDFAKFLVEEGIDSISITPDSLINTLNAISEIEKEVSA